MSSMFVFSDLNFTDIRVECDVLEQVGPAPVRSLLSSKLECPELAELGIKKWNFLVLVNVSNFEIGLNVRNQKI